MPITITTDEGKEMEVFTPEEVEQQKAEATRLAEEAKQSAESIKAEAEATKAEVERLKTVIADKNENFKRYKDMTEEEKAKFSSEQIETLKRIDETESKYSQLKEEYDNDKKSRIESFKSRTITEMALGNDDLIKKIEENFNLINLEGSTEEVIKKKVELAYNMLGEEKPKNNPLRQSWNGESPKMDKDDFDNSEKAKQIDSAIGEINI
jgi:uncharacterized protein YukE